MNHHTSIHLALLGISVFVGALLAGCADPPPEPVRARVMEPSRFQSPVVRGGLLPVPAEIPLTEQRALAVFQSVGNRRWTTANSEFQTLSDAARGLPTAPAPSGANSAQVHQALQNLSDAITVHDAISAMNYANNITRLTAEMADPYRKVIPTEAKIMAFYERRLEVSLASANVGQLKDTATSMGALWPRLRPLVTARDGEKLANTFGETISKLLAAQQVSEFDPLVEPTKLQVWDIQELFRTTEMP